MDRERRHDNGPSPRSHAREVLAALPVLAFLLLLLAGGNPRAETRGNIHAADSTDTTSSTVPEKATTPMMWPPYKVDSLYKHLNILVEAIGDTTGRDVNREVVVALQQIDHWRGRDSSYVFEGDSCITITLYLGATPDVPDTIRWTNNCMGFVDPCLDTLTIPLGCWETRTETNADTMLVNVCDTTYYGTDTLRTYYKYHVFEDYQYQLMTLLRPCTLPQLSSTQTKIVKKGYRYYALELPNVPFPYPADDSCFIVPYAIAEFNLMFGKYGQGTWYVDSVVTSYGTREVDKSLWGLPGVYRDTSNCRTDTLIGSTVLTYEEWVYSGRDTTIIDNECDCLEPYFVCEGGVLDSTREVKYIYDYVVDRDTIKAPCPDEVYQIPIGAQTHYVPAQTFDCTADSAILWGINHIWLSHGSVSWAPGLIEVTYYGEWACRDCEPTLEEPPAMPDTRYFDPADLTFWPCGTDTCEIEYIIYKEVVAPCCSNDTTVTFYCGEGNFTKDSVQITYRTPHLGGPCLDSVIVGIVPGDSTKILVDSLVTWKKFYSPRSYVLAWRDTCVCEPYLNGRLFCGPLWIVKDCGEQPYWGTDGRFHIPCSDTETSLTEIWTAHESLVKRTYDSLLTLRREIERLEAKIDSCCALGGGDPWAYENVTENFTPVDGKTYFIDATSGGVEIQAPDPSLYPGMIFEVKRIDSSENTVTFGSAVDGTPDVTLSANEARRVMSNGTNWYFISSY